MELGLVVLVVLECVYGVWKDLSGYLISYGVAVIILFEGGRKGKQKQRGRGEVLELCSSLEGSKKDREVLLFPWCLALCFPEIS